MNPTQEGRARPSVNDTCLDDVKIYGKRPTKLLKKIKIIKDKRNQVEAGADVVGPRIAENSL